MALVLPDGVNYAQALPALPDTTQCINVAASPVNGAEFAAGQQIMFDLLNRGFLVPDSMYLSYKWTVAKGSAAADVGFFRGTPAYTPFNRLDLQIGSQTVDTIQSYNVVCNTLVQLSLDVAQKYGMQSALGMGPSSGGVPTLEQLDSRGLPAATSDSGSFSAPLISMLSNAEKLIPLFLLPQVRVVLSLDNLSNMFNSAAGVTGITLSNVELRYKTIDMGGAVENIVLGMGEKLYIKSQSFGCSSQTLSSGSAGYNELIFNSRYASVKSLIAVNGGASVNAVNGPFDSVDLTSNQGDYSFAVGGMLYPQKPISTATAKTQALMELKSAMGSIFDKNNSMSINSAEFQYIANPAPTTSGTAPAKFFVGTSTEKLNSNNLLTGISTQNSPISYRINIPSSVPLTAPTTVSLIVNYDSLLEIDVATRQASVKA